METSGVKQACPNFFNLFINALIENIKKLLMGELILTLFKFANDVALMAETEKDLQLMAQCTSGVNTGYSASIILLAKQN